MGCEDGRAACIADGNDPKGFGGTGRLPPIKQLWPPRAGDFRTGSADGVY